MSFESHLENFLKERDAKEAPQQTSTRHEWASAVSARIANNPRDSHASPILRWHYVEDKKRKKGEMNEIDMADIKAALKGVKNSWFDCVEKDKKKINDLLFEKPINWKAIMEFKNDKR